MMNLQLTAHAFLTHGTPWHTSNVTVPIEDWHLEWILAPGASMLEVGIYPYPNEKHSEKDLDSFIYCHYTPCILYWLGNSFGKKLYNPKLGHLPFYLPITAILDDLLLILLVFLIENTPKFSLTMELPIKTMDTVSLLLLVQPFSCLQHCIVLSVKDSQHRWMTSDKGIFGWGCAVMSVMWLPHSNFRLPLLILKLQSTLGHLQHCQLT